MDYRLSGAAAEDIVRLYVEGAERFGEAQADAYHAGLERLFELIAAMPGIGRTHAEFDPPVRIHPHRAHLVVYRVEPDHVLIVRLPAARQDWQTLLAEGAP